MGTPEGRDSSGDSAGGVRESARTLQGGTEGKSGYTTRMLRKDEAPEKHQWMVKPKVGWLSGFGRCWAPCSGDSSIFFEVADTAVR